MRASHILLGPRASRAQVSCIGECFIERERPRSRRTIFVTVSEMARITPQEPFGQSVVFKPGRLREASTCKSPERETGSSGLEVT